MCSSLEPCLWHENRVSLWEATWRKTKVPQTDTQPSLWTGGDWPENKHKTTKKPSWDLKNLSVQIDPSPNCQPTQSWIKWIVVVLRHQVKGSLAMHQLVPLPYSERNLKKHIWHSMGLWCPQNQIKAPLLVQQDFSAQFLLIFMVSHQSHKPLHISSESAPSNELCKSPPAFSYRIITTFN